MCKSMSKLLFLKGVTLKDSSINANWQGDTSIELSDIYIENLSKQQLKRMELKQQGMQEDSDLQTERDQCQLLIKQEELHNKKNFSKQLEQTNVYRGPKLKGMVLNSIQELDQITRSIQGLVSCFHCTLNIEDPIYAISHEQCQLKVKAVFCSFVCGFSHSNKILNATKSNKYKEMLKNYYKLKYEKVINYKNIKIKKEDYCRFGGQKTHEQFQQYIQEQEKKLIQ